MKKITLFVTCLLVASILTAQIPQKFNYQAVLRSSSGQVLANKSVKIRLSFLSGSETGNSLYTEEHSVVTSSQGVVTVPAGGSSTILVGSFSSIDWSAGNIWLKVEVDENLTGSYTNLGAKQLLSVPYAMYAQSGNQGPKGDTGNGISGIVDNGNGTLTINYTNGGSYITPNLKGSQGEKGDPGSPGTGLANKGNWVFGTTYNPGDYVFATNTQQNGNAMWIVKTETPFTSNAEPRNDLANWIEFQAPQGPPGPLVNGTIGQTLRHNGTTWVANENIFNDGTSVGIGIALPTQKLDINGAVRFRGNIFDYDNLSGSTGQMLYKTANGIKWQTPNYAGISTIGVAGQLALWSNSSSLQGVANLSWGSSLQINSITTTDPDAPILEVKNSAGKVVLGVYQSGVRINVEDSPIVKGAKGGFAIGGLSGSGKVGESAIYMRVTSDSSRIYIKESAAKGAKGGFAIGGLSGSGKAILSRDLMYVAPDCTRIYVNENPTKGAKGGFAIGGLSGSGKGTTNNFIQLTPSNYFIGHQSGSKTTTGLYNNFLGYQAGLSNTTGNSNAFIGYNAGSSNTTGGSNVFIGNESGRTNTTGINNVFLGFNSGYSNNADYNTFIGNQTGFKNSGGYKNVMIGFKAGYENTSGICNVFVGPDAGGKNTTAWYNTFVGIGAGYNTTSNGYNSYYGINSGFAMTSGFNNAFYGSNSGYWFDGGSGNTFIGAEAGRGGPDNDPADPAGHYNTALGSFSGVVLEGASNNVLLGAYTGSYLRTGTSNVFIGYGAGFFETGSNKFFIDNQIRADAATSYTSSLIYGEFSSIVANQLIRVNGKLGVNKQPLYDIDANGSINSASYYIGGIRKDLNWDNAYTSRLSSASGTAPLTLTLSSNALSGSIADATTSAKGVVQLSNSYGGTSQTLATTEKSVSDGLATKVTGSGITMGKINLVGDGVIASVGSHSLERSGNNIIVKNNTGTWSHVWWQGQQGTTFVGNAYAVAAGGSSTIITLSPPTNSWGYEIHFGDVDSGTAYCSVWIQYSQGRLVGHYTKF